MDLKRNSLCMEYVALHREQEDLRGYLAKLFKNPFHTPLPIVHATMQRDHEKMRALEDRKTHLFELWKSFIEHDIRFSSIHFHKDEERQVLFSTRFAHELDEARRLFKRYHGKYLDKPQLLRFPSSASPSDDQAA